MTWALALVRGVCLGVAVAMLRPDFTLESFVAIVALSMAFATKQDAS